MNTKISYMYRDGDNYKFHYESIVSGEISKEQVKTIISCLQDGECFIPAFVGLPCDYAAGYDYDEQSDHPFCELSEDGFTPTVAGITVDMTVAGLVAAFQKMSGHWEAPENEIYVWAHSDCGTVLERRKCDDSA